MDPYDNHTKLVDLHLITLCLPIIRPRLIRAVPANIARVIENFEAVQSTVSFEENNQ